MSGVAALPSVVRLGQVDSTQAVAFALAAEGAADGTVVVADSQAAGRGRRGRACVVRTAGTDRRRPAAGAVAGRGSTSLAPAC